MHHFLQPYYLQCVLLEHPHSQFSEHTVTLSYLFCRPPFALKLQACFNDKQVADFRRIQQRQLVKHSPHSPLYCGTNDTSHRHSCSVHNSSSLSSFSTVHENWESLALMCLSESPPMLSAHFAERTHCLFIMFTYLIYTNISLYQYTRSACVETYWAKVKYGFSMCMSSHLSPLSNEAGQIIMLEFIVLIFFRLLSFSTFCGDATAACYSSPVH